MIYSSTLHAQASDKAQEYLTGWQRARAELKNYRQRVGEDSQQAHTRAKHQMIASLIPVADNFRAIGQHVPEELKNHPWTTGVLHVARQLDQVLTELELESFGEIGDVFDPTHHEAIAQVASAEHGSGQIAEVIQPGYKLGGHVVRPARVKVAI